MAKKRTSDSLVAEVRDLLKECWDADRDNRAEALRDLKFYAGDQWPDYIRQKREADKKPVLTINRLQQFVNQVANEVRLNPPSIRVVPVDGEQDQPIADIYTGLLRDIQYRSRARHVYSTAALHMIVCGLGWMRVETRYESDDSFDQEILIRPIVDPLSVYIDPASVEPDGSDARFAIVTSLIPRRRFEAEYPDARAIEVEAPSEDGPPSTLYWRERDCIRVAEYWRKVPERRRIAELDNGQVIDITGSPRELLAAMPIVRDRDVDGYRIVQDIVSGAEVLAPQTKWAGKYIPIVKCIGTEIPLETATVRHGLVRFARDPQQLYNFWRSSTAEMIALAPKAPYLVTLDMIAPYKALWDEANVTSRPYLPYVPDPSAPGAMPQRVPQADIPAAMMSEASVAVEDMKAATGLYNASLGQPSNEKSGRAILARQREGDVASYHYSDNLVLSLEHLGRVLVDLIPRIYDTERTVRILDEDERQNYVRVNRVVGVDEANNPILQPDLSHGRYDVRVRIGPSNTTRRMEAAESMMQFVQAYPAAAPLIGDLIAEAMDWPGAEKIVERLRRAIPPQILGEAAPQEAQQAQPDPQQMAMRDEALRMAQEAARAELGKKQAEAMRAMAQADEIATRVELQQQAFDF